MSRPVSLLKAQPKEQDSFYFNPCRKGSNINESVDQATLLQMGICKSTRGRMQEKQWTMKQQKLLYQLHEKLGNRWSQISTHFQDKTDNDIKNHLFSRLRLSIRHLNKKFSIGQTKKTKEIKNSLLYKLISICQEKFKPQSKVNKALIAFSYVLKKQLINFLYQHQEGQQTSTMEGISRDFELFGVLSKNSSFIGKQQLGLLTERMERQGSARQLGGMLSHRENSLQVKIEQPSSPIAAEQPTKQQILESQHTHQLFFQLVSSGHHHDAIPSFIRSTTPDENDLISQLQKFQLSLLPPLSSVPEEEGEFNELNLYYDFFNESQSPSI